MAGESHALTETPCLPRAPWPDPSQLCPRHPPGPACAPAFLTPGSRLRLGNRQLISSPVLPHLLAEPQAGAMIVFSQTPAGKGWSQRVGSEPGQMQIRLGWRFPGSPQAGQILHEMKYSPSRGFGEFQTSLFPRGC